MIPAGLDAKGKTGVREETVVRGQCSVVRKGQWSEVSGRGSWIKFDEGFRADLVVEKKVIIELKSVEKVTPAHKKQIQTYLRLTGCKLGYLLNFGEALMKHGITRTVNNLEE